MLDVRCVQMSQILQMLFKTLLVIGCWWPVTSFCHVVDCVVSLGCRSYTSQFSFWNAYVRGHKVLELSTKPSKEFIRQVCGYK